MTVVHEEEERNNDNKIMASNIISIINNQEFWMNLVELEKILYPYCTALNLLQKDKARLYDVLHSFGYFMQCTLECIDENYKEMMIRRLERRWKTWEQPLLILSFFYTHLINYNFLHQVLNFLTFILTIGFNITTLNGLIKSQLL